MQKKRHFACDLKQACEEAEVFEKIRQASL